MENSMENVRYLISGDSAVTVEFGNTISPEINRKIRAFKIALERARIEGIIETVPTYRSLLVCYRPEVIRYGALTERLKEVLSSSDSIQIPPPSVVEIPVLYGGEMGPDLAHVAECHGLTKEEVIKIHTSRDYLIYMLGFIAGFPYLGGMDERIATPRLENPRVKIEGGSVGIAGAQTGIYPVASPGGWQLIGRTPVKLYDADREKPVLLEAGQYIRFRSVSEDEYHEIEKQAESGKYSCAVYEKEAIHKRRSADNDPGYGTLRISGNGNAGFRRHGSALGGVGEPPCGKSGRGGGSGNHHAGAVHGIYRGYYHLGDGSRSGSQVR